MVTRAHWYYWQCVQYPHRLCTLVNTDSDAQYPVNCLVTYRQLLQCTLGHWPPHILPRSSYPLAAL